MCVSINSRLKEQRNEFLDVLRNSVVMPIGDLQRTLQVYCEFRSNVIAMVSNLDELEEHLVRKLQKLGSILHNITKIDISQLEQRIKEKKVSCRSFDFLEISEEMSLPVKTLFSYWIGGGLESSGKGQSLLFIYNIIMRLLNENCIPPIIQSISEYIGTSSNCKERVDVLSNLRACCSSKHAKKSLRWPNTVLRGKISPTFNSLVESPEKFYLSLFTVCYILKPSYATFGK
ncbi:hypothetical protein ACROYT_G014862 [Oculina patagonica]